MAATSVPSGKQPPQKGPDKDGLYHAGTLTYTTPALFILFFWPLWGDFCYTVMESVTGPIMQLKFKTLDVVETLEHRLG